MRFSVKRILLLIALIGIVFSFWRSEQFGRAKTKVVSVDFSPDGKWLAISRNHALERFDAEYETYLGDFSRSIHVLNFDSGKSRELMRQPIPIDSVDDAEWLRILGQRPNYESALLPYSPVQFLPVSGRLAVYNFENETIESVDVQSHNRKPLVKLTPVEAEQKLTLGWFRVLPDEQSLIVEDNELNLIRYGFESGELDPELPMGEPFYINTQNLSLGPFIPLRVLGILLGTPRPIYGVCRNPTNAELAVSTVLQICFVNFDGSIPLRFLTKMKIGSTIQYYPDGKNMVAIFHDIIRVYDVELHRTIKILSNEKQMVTAFAISPDCKKFASGDNQGVVRIWDAQSQELLSTLKIGESWRFDWRVPYALGFAWVLVAVATFGFEPFSNRRRPDFESANEALLSESTVTS